MVSWWSDNYYGAARHGNVQKIVFVWSANEAKKQTPAHAPAPPLPPMVEDVRKKSGSVLT